MNIKIDPNWIRVKKNSSQISEIMYDPKNNVLYIVFSTNDAVYSYENVPQEEFDKLNVASSVGSYFHKNIKGVYKHKKV